MAFSALEFTVRRREPELIVPAKPTPYGSKFLSDIDDRKGHRFHTPTIHFYRNKRDICMASTCKIDNIVDVIKKALANTLIFYYPFAGRLREAPGEKLLVECTGQGVLFVEADADFSLSQLGGDFLKPPFPYLEQLVYAPAEAEDILHCPLLFIQVTRLLCGGFIIGFSNNHTICDAQGLHQFKTALAEIARGEPYPSMLPVWERELLNARDPPQVTFAHQEYDVIANYKEKFISLDDMVQRSFFFGPKELTVLRQRVPPHQQACTTFEFLTAWLWRCRTVAIGYDPKEEVRVAIAVNTRGKFHSPLPTGFYGNAVAYPVAVSTTEKLIQDPLSYALELVKKAKDEVNEEYIRSTADLMSIKGRPIISTVRTYFVSDLRRVWNADEVDFGYGEVVYGGQAIGNKPTSNHWMSSYYMSHKNNKGDKGSLVSVCLPTLAMKKFVVEIESMHND
ncbi:benzyl alcohol O-benzoyltransferase-like [Papaver somniferum]|uniref:benzyl alcohol O-benzoyltransferase-like n=1 Tax=Papaver somniferum TaxID=3469 RepID=UPI000E6F4C07|nr:benzyl alcohol O-benzoyltransferase-like [Papaver somniferum]